MWHEDDQSCINQTSNHESKVFNDCRVVGRVQLQTEEDRRVSLIKFNKVFNIESKFSITLYLLFQSVPVSVQLSCKVYRNHWTICCKSSLCCQCLFTSFVITWTFKINCCKCMLVQRHIGIEYILSV